MKIVDDDLLELIVREVYIYTCIKKRGIQIDRAVSTGIWSMTLISELILMKSREIITYVQITCENKVSREIIKLLLN